MPIVRWMLGAVVLGGLAGACGGNAEQAAAGGGRAGSGGTTSSVPPVARVPLKHRVAAVACDRERPPGSVWRIYGNAAPDDAARCATDADCGVPSGCDGCRVACVQLGDEKVCISSSSASCMRDEDCADGTNGRCEDLRGAVCTYDECFADAECITGGPCACEGGFWSESNACLAGNCRTDADCGNGHCSPTFGDCGDYSGVIGYYCHTPQDTCVDDADCTEDGPGYCMYRPELARWACGYGQCVG